VAVADGEIGRGGHADAQLSAGWAAALLSLLGCWGCNKDWCSTGMGWSTALIE